MGGSSQPSTFSIELSDVSIPFIESESAAISITPHSAVLQIKHFNGVVRIWSLAFDIQYRPTSRLVHKHDIDALSVNLQAVDYLLLCLGTEDEKLNLELFWGQRMNKRSAVLLNTD